MKKILVLVAFGLLLAAPSAQAMPNMGGERFAAMDSDKSKGLSRDEFKKGLPSINEKAFDMIDTDKDGQVSQEEWTTFFVDHGKKAAEQNNAQEQKPAGQPLITPPAQ